MADNIALEKSSESSFVKAIKNIKTILKKNEFTAGIDEVKRDVPQVKTKRKVLVGKSGAKNKNRPKQYAGPVLGKGVVYLSHIPKDFREEDMKSYFNQFGRVTRLNLVKSNVNGQPKGYAFIEFMYSEVAQVVAETMNNYLMDGKLLKAEYIPEERVRRNMFPRGQITPFNCPRSREQRKWIHRANKKLSDEEVAEMAGHELKRLNKIKKQMEDNDIVFNCQVEDAPPVILEIDESDDEIVYKVHPLVTRIVKKKDETRRSKTPPVASEEKKGCKRSLTAGSSQPSAPEKKRMSLLQGLKSKSEVNGNSFEYRLDKTPVLELGRVDQSPEINIKKSPALKSTGKKENSVKKSSTKKTNFLERVTTKEVKLVQNSTTKNVDSVLKLKRDLEEKNQSSKNTNTTPKSNAKKVNISIQKSKTPAKTKKTPQSANSSSAKKLKKTPSSQKTLVASAKFSSSTSKSKKTPLLIGRKRLAFSTSKKKSNIPRLMKVVKLKSPK